ncbi:MAG: PDZ domain-containing protein [Phycisphaerae bacterium]|nr:PDZ domain-containing protein [Phycisphaerae bacterium]
MNAKMFGLMLALITPVVGLYVSPAQGDSTNFNVYVSASADSSRGWLGVQLAEVSPALAAHLPAAVGGVMVVNVVQGSPAEKAGLEKHDIIVEFNGDGITEGVSGLAKTIGELAPEGKSAMKVLRGGKEFVLSATLASRPAGDQIKWLYDFAPEAVTREIVKTHGKILSKDEDGNWHIEDLGDLSELQSLPDDIRSMLPEINEITTRIFVDDDRKSINTMVMRDGESIAIAQQDGGEINVKRTDRDGNETEATYADVEAFKTADSDAYEIYEQATSGSNIQIQVGPDSTFMRSREEWKQQIESVMKNARETMENARKQVDKIRLGGSVRFPGLPGHPFFSWDEDGPMSFSLGEDADSTTRSFRVNPDGQIEVTTRKGATKVIKVFRDEADLQERAPELHKEYAKVMAVE